MAYRMAFDIAAGLWLAGFLGGLRSALDEPAGEQNQINASRQCHGKAHGGNFENAERRLPG